MFKKFMLKKMMASKLKEVPAEHRAQVEALLESHPEFLMQLAQEIRDEMKQGTDQQTAFMTVAGRHKETLQRLLGEQKQG